MLSAQAELDRAATLMRTSFGVNTSGREAEALDGFSADDVRFKYFVDVCEFHKAVPDRFGIDDDGDAVLALVEAAGGVDADAFGEAALFDEFLEAFSNGLRIFCGAAAAGMARLALVRTDEDVAFVSGHWTLGLRKPVYRLYSIGTEALS